MAHIVLSPHPDHPDGLQLFINGIDFTNEVYRDVRLVEVGAGDPLFSEVGVQVTFALSRLDLGGDTDVQVTNRLPAVAQLVRSMTGEAEPVDEANDRLQQLIEHQRELAAKVDRLTVELKTHPDRTARGINRALVASKKRARK